MVALAGCASSSPPPPQAPISTSPRYGAPTVSRPLDVTTPFDAPCRQLSPEELGTLGVRDEGSGRSYMGSNQCRWTTQSGAILSLSVDRDRDLLVDTYRARLLPIFQPVQVAGYPAVRQQTAPENNICTVTIGLGPKQALEADWTGLGTLKPGDPDPCERAETAAAMVIRKLPPQR
ncbi:DUF3558 domain-containing protein [Actinomycetospora soli]|uniref:DUF3558 domain-containing protein n=1 Tax=Actinomycetospora soli TaxID=2893887 RepID=UPI001E545303|nr:DUF3558 domain-containing protein [Actinomycetospora soli]MCD2186572.1 DUF3558 domain-containing protein [Actinomycetospora soli]